MDQYSERLNLLMDALRLSGARLSHYSSLDCSGISRFRNGIRIPAKDSPTAAALTEGIVRYAAENDKLDIIRNLVKNTNIGSSDDYRTVLNSWLYEGTTPVRRKVTRKAGYRDGYFATRFDRAMTLSGFSNIRISQLLNVDASLISRYRSGVRSPRSNPRTMQQVSSVLWQRICTQNMTGELAGIMNLPESEVTGESFYNWLFGSEEPETGNDSGIEKLLHAVNDVSSMSRQAVNTDAVSFSLDEGVLTDKRCEYTGFGGLQQAVIRFLTNAVSKGAKELLLYSDQTIEWMIDPSFRGKWAGLMTACVQKGIKIRIIHNIDRDLDEMNSAIISWLPLYTTGMIESFYSTKTGGERFSHTIFLAPGIACIEADHVRGMEATGTYRYHVEKEDLKFYESAFNLLMDGCRSLVRFLPYKTEYYPEEELSFEKNGIISHILRDSVVIDPASGPEFSIVFNHPLMSRAFRAYAGKNLN